MMEFPGSVCLFSPDWATRFCAVFPGFFAVFLVRAPDWLADGTRAFIARFRRSCVGHARIVRGFYFPTKVGIE